QWTPSTPGVDTVWVGLGGTSATSGKYLVQIGTYMQSSPWAWYEIHYPSGAWKNWPATKCAVKAGDHVVASVFYNYSNRYVTFQMALNGKPNCLNTSFQLYPAGNFQTAEAIIERPA